MRPLNEAARFSRLPSMKILHTSDWHLGNRLMEQSRHGEFRAFLDWLLALMEREQVEVLLLCGDVFDSSTPSDSARELYCDFLSRADATGCRHVIVTGGNHDSVQQLRVAAPLLRRHHACVVAGLRTEQAADCLVPLCDAEGREAALVAAVPFLRVADVARRVDAADAEARCRAYADGVGDCYAAVAEAARAWKSADPARAGLPVIAMGHVALGGAEMTASSRSLVIGAVETVSASIFEPVFDYVALGHIHKPCSAGGGRIRYCGSPLPMGFDEARQPHEVLLLDVAPGRCEVVPVAVPRFALFEEAACASLEEADALLDRLKRESEAGVGAPLPVWLKVSYTGGAESLGALGDAIRARAEDCHLRALRLLRPASLAEGEAGQGGTPLPSLQDIEPQQLFRRRLDEWAAALESPPSAEDCAMLTGLFHDACREAGL